MVLETFIRGILKGNNLHLGMPVVVLNIISIVFILPMIFDYAMLSYSNALHVTRMIIIWCNIQYLLMAYYNSVLPRTIRRRQHITRIDIVVPQQAFIEDDINDIDDENVHDSGVQSSVAEAIMKLKTKTQLNISLSNSLEGIRNYIFSSSASNQTKEYAICVLRKMETENIRIERLNLREKEILQLIWNRIHDPVNASVSETLKESLMLQLADAMRDHVNEQCPTGRVNRAVQSLELIDREHLVILKTNRLLKEELTLLFGPLRTEILEKCTPDERTAYENGESLITEKIRSLIKKELHERYIVPNLLTVVELQEITEPLLSAI